METQYILIGLVCMLLLGMSVSRQRSSAFGDHVTAEVELRATGIAATLFAELVDLPYDEVTEPLTPQHFTPETAFGGAASWASAADLDDVHGLTTTRSVASGGGTLDFQALATVRYMALVDGAFVPSPIPTYHKEVSLRIEGPMDLTMTSQRVFVYE